MHCNFSLGSDAQLPKSNHLGTVRHVIRVSTALAEATMLIGAKHRQGWGGSPLGAQQNLHCNFSVHEEVQLPKPHQCQIQHHSLNKCATRGQ